MKILLIVFTLAISSCLTVGAAATEPDDLYQEQRRGQIHFSPPQQWMNDPNGMVYYNGEYHLFYQYNPYGNTWGPMHWGHAISEDLVHWEHMPIALFPDNNGAIWSGSAVVDVNNTSGLGTAGEPPLVAIFTQHDHLEASFGVSKQYQSQGIAYSNDNGRNWTMYEGNPVLESPDIRDFRDPKVFWYEPGEKWVMSLAVRDHIRFYASKDLKHWELTGSFGKDLGSQVGVWECPDLIKLPIAGTDEHRYVLLVSVGSGAPNGGSGTQYFVGDFDGETFTLDADEAARMRVTPAVFPEGTVFEDFDDDFSGWSGDTVTFGLRTHTDIDGHEHSLLASGNQGDWATGVLESTEFVIDAPYINFRLSGGNMPERIGMRLVVDGQTVRASTGDQLERPQNKSWIVADLIGKSAQIEIFDRFRGPWGQVAVDDITFADSPASVRQAPAKWLDFGTDNYAGVTWSGVPESDGRVLFIGWMSNWKYSQAVPTRRWRSAMTLPRELQLKRTTRGLEVMAPPVAEVAELRQKKRRVGTRVVDGERVLVDDIDAAAFELSLRLNVGDTKVSELVFSNDAGERTTFRIDRDTRQYVFDRTASGAGIVIEPCEEICIEGIEDNFLSVQTAPLRHEGDQVSLHVFVDASSMEIFVNGGETVFTSLVFPESPYDKVSLRSEGRVRIDDAIAYELTSIWDEDGGDE